VTSSTRVHQKVAYTKLVTIANNQIRIYSRPTVLGHLSPWVIPPDYEGLRVPGGDIYIVIPWSPTVPSSPEYSPASLSFSVHFAYVLASNGVVLRPVLSRKHMSYNTEPMRLTWYQEGPTHPVSTRGNEYRSEWTDFILTHQKKYKTQSFWPAGHTHIQVNQIAMYRIFQVASPVTAPTVG
jgi:hypothetical protein